MEGFFKYKVNKTEDKNVTSIKVKCKYCGHTNSIPAFKEDKICNWCHNKIKNTSPAHFKYKLLKLMKENDKNESN